MHLRRTDKARWLLHHERGGGLEKKKNRETLRSKGGFQLLMRDRYC